jgi:hypothetical protein
MHSNGTYPTARPRPRPPRREFVTTICTEDLGRYAGVGLTLEQVIEEELKNVSAVAPGQVEESDDLVIWEGNKIAALIRIGPGGRPVVTRLDRPAADPDPSVSAGGEVPAADVINLASGPGGSSWAPAVTETRAAIRQFQTLLRIAEEVRQRCPEASHAGASPAPCEPGQEFWQRWSSAAREVLAISELHLCRALDNLAAAVRNHTHPREAGSRSPRCGVIEGGRLYLVHDRTASEALVVVDLKNVFRLDPPRGSAPADVP